MSLRHRTAVLLTSGLLLAACDGGGGGGGGGGGVVQGIATLGQAFVNAFNLGPNDEPVDAQSVDLVLTPTEEPFNP
ncbi:hypothetical protein ACOXXX_04400 [Thalassococcus sp. BH17M4-6]|uniref:hypothetical protein n=1 Tax=Thalassococcus sp. BH17M4-6 TaxID=3413148 RepID=UPI003BC76E89